MDGNSFRACGEPWCSVGPPRAGGDVSGASVCLGSLQGHTDELWGLAIHASKPQFLTCGHDRHATLWDAVDHRPIWDKVIEVGLHVLVHLSYKNSSATHWFIFFLHEINGDINLSQRKCHLIYRLQITLL